MLFRLPLIAAAAALGAAALAQTSPPYVPGEVLVKFKASTTGLRKSRVHAAIGATVQGAIPQIRWESIRLPQGMSVEQAVAYYRSRWEVQHAEPRYLRSISYRPNDPRLNEQYGLERIQAFAAWDLHRGSSTIKVAVIDNGCDINHPDLRNKVSDGWDVMDNDPDPSPVPNDQDMHHGTHTAGTVGADTNNGLGVAGTAPLCRIMPIRAGHGYFIFRSVEAIIHAADRGASVISMSYGGPGQSQAEADAVNYAHARGVVLVGAAGNDGSASSNFYPANFPNVITVGASDPSDLKAQFSNFGPDWVEVAAPGVGILSTTNGGGYGVSSGTSMACPKAAGVVAVLRSRAPRASNVEIRQVLEQNCDVIPGNWVTYGRVNLLKALRALGVRVTVETPPVFLGVWEGTALTSSSRVVANDGLYFSVAPKLVQNLGHVASAYFRFSLPHPSAEAESIALVFNGSYVTGGTGQIFLWNYSAGRWDNLRSFSLGSSEATVTALLRSSLGTYVSPNEEVRVLVRGILPASSPIAGGAPLQIDFLQLRETYVTVD